MKATLVALVENKPGVLNRVVSLFRRRNFNMDSLTVGRTHHSEVSRMTIVMDCDTPSDTKKIIMNLYKLVDVIEVQDLTDQPAVTRDIALVKISAKTADSRNGLTDITYEYGARLVDIGPEVVIVEVTGRPEKVEAAINALEPFGIVEVVRSGSVSMGRGTRIMKQVDYQSKRQTGRVTVTINREGVIENV
jgi:acetolactate synthase-1/3 small subunit